MNTPVKTVDTFGDYCNHQIADKLLSLSQNVTRIDVYRVLSLKQETRESRGADGMRIYVQKETPIQHKNFGKVLKVGGNKTALFNTIANVITFIRCETTIVSTRESSMVSNKVLNYSQLQPCNQEKAVTRLFLHVKDASVEGPYINDVGQNQEILTPSPLVGGDIPTLGRRNCRYLPPRPPRLAAVHLNHPPSPFLPTLPSTSANIYKNTEILYTIKSSTYVQMIDVINVKG